MAEGLLFDESISSNRTEALFLALTALFALLLAWRVNARGLDALAWVLLCLAAIFLFYSVNYRTLRIRLTAQSLKLTFGIFSWTVLLENIEDCELDRVPLLLRMGGAGIHFMTVRKRYRASFNFLEYPRVVVALRRKSGPVRDISFSTRRPDEIVRLIREAGSARVAGTSVRR